MSEGYDDVSIRILSQQSDDDAAAENEAKL